MDLNITEDGQVQHNDLTFDKMRGKVSGLHFSKESLTKREREMLEVMEGLLAIIDTTAGGYFHGTPGELGLEQTESGVNRIQDAKPTTNDPRPEVALLERYFDAVISREDADVKREVWVRKALYNPLHVDMARTYAGQNLSAVSGVFPRIGDTVQVQMDATDTKDEIIGIVEDEDGDTLLIRTERVVRNHREGTQDNERVRVNIDEAHFIRVIAVRESIH